MSETSLLIVDYAMATPEINEGIALPFARLGIRVEYRPFYPGLVRTAPTTFRILALLAGRTPDFPSGQMSEHETRLVAAFVRDGGTLILAPNLEGGEGAHERYLFNRILSHLGVPIRICNDQIADTVHRYTATLFERALYRPIPGHPVSDGVPDTLAMERSTSLLAGEGVSVFLTIFDTAMPSGVMPVIAAARS